VISFLSRPVRLIALIVLVGVAGGAYWVWHGASTSTAVDKTDALAEFRDTEAVAPTESRPGIPRAGVYRYRVTGEESAGTGVLSAERALPSEAIYVISPNAGGYREDLRLSEEHVEEARFQVTPEGTSAAWRRTKVTFVGIGEDSRDDVVPVALDHPRPMKAGATWGGKYTLGPLVVTYTARVTGAGTAKIDGRDVRTVTYRTDATFTGPTPGTRTDIVTFAPSLSLPVTWSIDQTTGGSADFTISADLALVSGTPEQ